MKDYAYRERILTLLQRDSQYCVSELDTNNEYKKEMILEKIEQCRTSITDIKSILLVAENSVNWIVLFFACLMEGKKLYALDAKSSDVDVISTKEQLNIDCIVADRVIPNVKTYTFNELYSRETQKKNKGTLFELVLFTTGTTGIPKGVRMTLDNILTVVDSFQNKANFSEFDSTLLITPFSHVMGFVMMMNSICHGGRSLISNNEGSTLYSILNKEITLMAAPPVLLNILRSNARFIEPLKKFRLLISGGAGLCEDAYEWYKENSINLINGYGMTECVAVVGLSAETDDKRQLQALDWCEIKLDNDGEILIRGKGVCETYINGERIPDDEGWYHTGDVGSLNGRVFTISHRKNNIVVLQNGFKINIDNLEERISHIENIQDCRVFIKKENEKVCVELLQSSNDEKKYNLTFYKTRIKEILKYFEKVDEIYISDKITVKRGKKIRYE